MDLERCKEVADTMEKANFIWYAPKKQPNNVPSHCVLYEECDLEKNARFPRRHGFTMKKNSCKYLITNAIN